MAKLTVKLKQHTPLIHFQHDQDGATLRATELKSKLDKFIRENYKKNVFENIFDGKEKLIEDNILPLKNNSVYKIRVVSETEKKLKHATFISKGKREQLKKEGSVQPKSGTPYFGDNLSLEFKDISLVFFSFNEQILRLIKKVLPYIFIYENFGTRQSKGFGSFTPITYNFGVKEEEYKYNSRAILKQNFDIFYEKKGFLEDIQSDYSSLKSGKNYPYEKSCLMEFLYPQIRWEKARIKHELKQRYPKYFNKLFSKNNHQKFSKETDFKKEILDEDTRYIRGLLGLAENYEFLCKNKYDAKKPDYKNKIIIKINPLNNEIQRFKSPINFKIIENKIYLIPRKINEELFDAKFDFRFIYKEKSKLGNQEEGNLFTISTPSKEEFNLISFLDKSLGKFGFKKVGEN